MPDFTKAEISTTSQDLSGYKSFLKRLEVGQTVTLPLEPGEGSRSVVRSLNAAAAQSNVRLSRLPSTNGSVRFRVLPPQKRAVTITEEAKRARVEKARATREARRQVSAMGLGGLAGDPTSHQGDRPLDAAPPVQDALAAEAAPADELTEPAPAVQAEQPDTTQIEAPEEAPAPDVAGAPAGRSPRTRRRSSATTSG